jgi:hypothetical protein
MKHQKRHRRVTTGILGLSGLMLGLFAAQYEPVAQANDDKIFAPQVCVPLDDRDDENDKAKFRVDRVTQNQDEDYQDFLCPLIREDVKGELETVWVRVENENEKDDTPPECCVYSVSVGGSRTDFECETADDDEGIESLEIDTKRIEHYDNGHYVVKCELGEDDSIISIRTSEKS